MCGRYDIWISHPICQMVKKNLTVEGLRPGTKVPVVGYRNKRLAVFKAEWGFTFVKKSERIIHARAEGVQESYLFSELFLSRRVILPMSQYYERRKGEGDSEPYCMRSDQPLYVAGLWREEEDGPHVVMLTREAHGRLNDVHHRMPLMLPVTKLRRWLDDKQAAQNLLEAIPPRIVFCPIGKKQRLF